MTLSDEQIQELLRVGNPTNEECRLIRMGWDAAIARMRTKSVPEGWLRAIDEALVTAHIGVANAHDTYEQAKAKLDNLLGFHVDVATDPDVNGGWKLVPRPPTPTMVKAGLESSHVLNVHRVLACYDAMLAAAPEAKP